MKWWQKLLVAVVVILLIIPGIIGIISAFKNPGTSGGAA